MADKYDKLLSRALVKLKEDEFRCVPEENEIEHTFSKKYLKVLEKILHKLDRSYWKYVNTVAKKIAVIIVTLIIAFSSLMTVEAFREMIANFVITIYESFTKIEQESKTEQHIGTYYSLNTLPIKYVKCVSHHSETLFFQVWDNDDSKSISLNQVAVNNTNLFNSEHGELSEAIVNDTPCLICKDNIQYYCYWEFDGYRFELVYPLDLGEEFMSEVVGNLIEIDPDELVG